MRVIHWLWYPGDFEIYHAMLQNFSREERGFFWPAYYGIEDCRKHVHFSKEYELEKEEVITIHANCLGYYRVNNEKRRFDEPVVCGPGKVFIEVFAGSPTGVPSIYVEGETIFSNEDWMVDDFVSEPVAVGYNPIYVSKEQNPSIWVYDKKEYCPEYVEEKENGVLYRFETELTASLKVNFSYGFKPIQICYGESEVEALDTEMCYYSQILNKEDEEIPRRAFRYIFIPEIKAGDVELLAEHQYVDIPVKASFSSSDETLNRIWDVATWTFQLCSGIFFIDGVKRDKWIWSGDAYQSYFVNQYLFFDEEINKRTIWSMAGNGQIRQHINTILDYSMYWIISVLNHYKMTGDEAFVKAIFPRVKAMMTFLEEQLDENGFIVGREGDWIFIDWSEMDKGGALCAEQILLVVCYRTMQAIEKIMKTDTVYFWEEKEKILTEKIQKYFWSEEKGAFIDCFSTGKNNVTRHANIFAILFGIITEEQKKSIKENVLFNDEITQITTPYFKFYEMEALSFLGERDKVMNSIKEYWGGMLKQGAVTFWEEYDPTLAPEQQYEMYGDPFGKSFCHAWAASPIYLLARYYIGLEPTDIAYKTFQVKPDLDSIEEVDCTLPIKGGTVHVCWNAKKLSIQASVTGGTLVLDNKEYEIPLEQSLVIKRNC